MYTKLDAAIDSIDQDTPDLPPPLEGIHTHRDEDGKKLLTAKVNAKVSTKEGGKTVPLMASAFIALGGKCACCGEDDWNTLEIDHVHGDGVEERKGRTRPAIAKQAMLKGIIENGPQGRYQLLCGNCHNKKTAKDRGYDKNKNKPV